jgi:hypothetical protein
VPTPSANSPCQLPTRAALGGTLNSQARSSEPFALELLEVPAARLEVRAGAAVGPAAAAAAAAGGEGAAAAAGSIDAARAGCADPAAAETAEAVAAAAAPASAPAAASSRWAVARMAGEEEDAEAEAAVGPGPVVGPAAGSADAAAKVVMLVVAESAAQRDEWLHALRTALASMR